MINLPNLIASMFWRNQGARAGFCIRKVLCRTWGNTADATRYSQQAWNPLSINYAERFVKAADLAGSFKADLFEGKTQTKTND
jgi:hypothetical protein